MCFAACVSSEAESYTSRAIDSGVVTCAASAVSMSAAYWIHEQTESLVFILVCILYIMDEQLAQFSIQYQSVNHLYTV